MKKTGAALAVKALENIGVRYTFGIPGVHNTELYDELGKSRLIEPVLVCHEGGGAFMADAVSRTSGSIGCLVIVPAAGMTHALSGIGEAYLDGIPMLVVSGGVRRDSGRTYQLHQLDQGAVLAGITKSYTLVERHADVMPAIYKAYETAITGEPGPVFVEIPVELQLFAGQVDGMPGYTQGRSSYPTDAAYERSLQAAADMLRDARRPGIYVGWGAVDAAEYTARLAEALAAPVATTFQGISAFDARHPLHTGVGFGPTSVPAAEEAFAGCDLLLACGVRFSELATGSYSMNVPEKIIHVDINPDVFNKNYPAELTVTGDSRHVLGQLVDRLTKTGSDGDPVPVNGSREKEFYAAAKEISRNKAAYRNSWTSKRSKKKVSPGYFFERLRSLLDDDAYMVVDDGKHTFLTAELFDVYKPRHFISPTDFNCMGYAVPASIGVKITRPQEQVACVVGDGAFLMTCMELLTAKTMGAGVMIFVFNDGELGQISQFQQIPLNRKTCTQLGQFDIAGVAQATGCRFLPMNNDADVDTVIAQALESSAAGEPVLIDVNIDYSRRTRLTSGVVKTNLSRFPTSEKVRFISRAIKRHIIG